VEGALLVGSIPNTAISYTLQSISLLQAEVTSVVLANAVNSGSAAGGNILELKSFAYTDIHFFKESYQIIGFKLKLLLLLQFTTMMLILQIQTNNLDKMY